MIPDSKLYYRAIIAKTVWYWHKNRHQDQLHRIEDLEVSPRSYSYLIFDKVTKDIQKTSKVSLL
jgi:hypothetical protein